MWILYALFYGLMMGFYSVFNKKTVEKTTPLAAIIVFNIVAFVMVFWRVEDAMQISSNAMLLVFAKSICVFGSWLFTYMALTKLAISKVAIITNLSVCFSVLAGICIFGEKLSYLNIFGAVLVLVGVALISHKKNTPNYGGKLGIVYAIFATIFHASATILDKIIMKSVTTGQMQFWYLFFVMIIGVVAYLAILAIKKQSVIKKTDFKNVYIYIAAIMLIIGDCFLFAALKAEGSMISIVSVLGKVSFIVSFAIGILFFKERKSWFKFLSLALAILGIVFTAL